MIIFAVILLVATSALVGRHAYLYQYYRGRLLEAHNIQDERIASLQKSVKSLCEEKAEMTQKYLELMREKIALESGEKPC